MKYMRNSFVKAQSGNEQAQRDCFGIGNLVYYYKLT